MNNLQIFELKLKDYRQYQGETVIDLETDPDRHINVIEGQNGSGKSNILNAITLCFYGEETHTGAQNDDALESDPYINKRRLQDLEPGESAEGFVEVTLGKEEPQYAFRRSFTTVKQQQEEGDAEERFNNSNGELRLTQRFGSHDWKPIPQPENILREILPTHVHQYFLFDGEQLDEFFEEGYTNRVKTAVLDVSHIELLNSAIEHLENVKKEYESRSSDLGGDVSDLQDRKEKAEQELERLKQKREDLKEDIAEANERIEQINDELAGSADDEVREKQQRREFLEMRLEEKEDQLPELKAEVGSSLARAGGIAYNADALVEAISLIEKYEASADGLPNLTEELLEAVLSRGECICGLDLTEHDDARGHLEDLLDESAGDTHETIEGRLRMQDALESGEGLIEELLANMEELEDTRDWIEEKETDLSRIHAQLEDEDTIDNDRARELEERREEIRGRIEEMNQEVGELRGKIEQQEDVVETRDEEWKEAMEEQEEHELLVRKSEFIEEGVERLQSIKSNILKEVRSKTQERLEQYYNDLIWKNEDYEIILTDDYEVKVFDPDGRKYLGSLSAGERQVLALAFMASLSKISGFSAPIVIDTPLGRISSDPKRRIAQNVPNYLDDSQVTFLMTDVEYSEDVKAFIEDEVSKEYHLEFQNGVTEVVAL